MPLIGHSDGIQRVRRSIAALAPTDVDLLILGETGSGKEVVAHAIHAMSGRSGPFVALICGALPETIFESEMFGHESGAFTGAVAGAGVAGALARQRLPQGLLAGDGCRAWAPAHGCGRC